MRFICQQSGHCCCDPNIIVTLTYRDIYRLFRVLNSAFNSLLQKITFYTLDSVNDNKILKQMVLKHVQTDQGNIVIGLRKLEEATCVFYKHPNCSIYSNRPLACRNYPFAFKKKKKQIITIWVKNALETCPGIGKGIPVLDKKIKTQGENFFNEIETHNGIIDNLNLEAKQGRPLTAREVLWMLLLVAEKESKNED